MTFYNGTTALGPAATVTNGVATLNLNTLPVSATNSITAQYSGDSNYAASTSTAVTVPVSQSSTTTAVTYFPSSPVASQNVTLTATVSASARRGDADRHGSVLQRYDFAGDRHDLRRRGHIGDHGPRGRRQLGHGQYSGDANFIASTSPAVSMTVAATATSATTVTFSPSSPSYGQTVTLTATVTPISPLTGAPTGTVEFFNGTTLLGSETLTAGTNSSTASFTTSSLPVAANSITAQYSGDSNFTSSTSSP